MDTQLSQQFLMGIDKRCAELTKELSAFQLDLQAYLALNRPPPSKQVTIQLPVIETAAGRFHPVGYWAGESFHRAWSIKDIYIGVLSHVWTACKARRAEIAACARRGARIRRYLAEKPGDLFPGKDNEWAQSHCTALPEGWCADTNLNARQMRQIVDRALAAAQLKVGRDVEIVWARRKVAACN